MKPDVPPRAVALTSSLQLHLQGILAPSRNCKLTWASFQEETVIGCSLWESASGSHTRWLGSPSSSASACQIIYQLNGLQLCFYGINYDRLSMINELIPVICVHACILVQVRARTRCDHYRRQISSIRTAGIHQYLPLTFLIAIDLFARHKYLCWRKSSLSQVCTRTHARASPDRQRASYLFVLLIIRLIKQREARVMKSNHRECRALPFPSHTCGSSPNRQMAV